LTVSHFSVFRSNEKIEGEFLLAGFKKRMNHFVIEQGGFVSEKFGIHKGLFFLGESKFFSYSL